MKKFLLYFFGVCCILGSIVGFSQYGVANGVTCIIIGLVLIGSARASGSAEHSAESNSLSDTAVESAQPTKTISFSVAGVTFDNESGKLRSRQTILRKIYFSDPPFDSDFEVRLERYFYNGDPAYYVYVGDYIIGNVPKEFVPYLESNIDRPYVIKDFEAYGGGNGKNYGAKMVVKYTDIE